MNWNGGTMLKPASLVELRCRFRRLGQEADGRSSWQDEDAQVALGPSRFFLQVRKGGLPPHRANGAKLITHYQFQQSFQFRSSSRRWRDAGLNHRPNLPINQALPIYLRPVLVNFRLPLPPAPVPASCRLLLPPPQNSQLQPRE